MEKYSILQNNKEIGQFVTIRNREDEDFLDEFYAMALPLVPDAGDENLKNKEWADLDEDLNFDINENHYIIKHLGRFVD